MTESPFLTELREFAASWRDGGPEPRVSTRDGVEAVRIAEAAAESSRTGRVVEMATPTVGMATSTLSDRTEEAAR